MNLKFTPRAAQQLKTVAQNEDINFAEKFLRIAVVTGGCSGLSYELGWDSTVLTTDTQAVLEEIPVLIDTKSYLYMEGTTLDFSDGLEGKGFHFINPQASRNCACGESFSV